MSVALATAGHKLRVMPKRRRTPTRPRDLNQLAKRIVDISTGQEADEPDRDVSPLSDRGAKGGKARAKKLSKKRRAEIAKKAAAARWRNQG